MALTTRDNGYGGQHSGEQEWRHIGFDDSNDSLPLDFRNYTQNHSNSLETDRAVQPLIDADQAQSLDAFFHNPNQLQTGLLSQRFTENQPFAAQLQGFQVVQNCQWSSGAVSIPGMASGNGNFYLEGAGNFEDDFPTESAGDYTVPGDADAAARALTDMRTAPQQPDPSSWGSFRANSAAYESSGNGGSHAPSNSQIDPSMMQMPPGYPQSLQQNAYASQNATPSNLAQQMLQQRANQRQVMNQQHHTYNPQSFPHALQQSQTPHASPTVPPPTGQYPGPTTTNNQSASLPTATFGSDHNFGAQGYQAAESPRLQEREANLLGVPGLMEAARGQQSAAGYGIGQLHERQRQSLPNHAGQLQSLGIDNAQVPEFNRPALRHFPPQDPAQYPRFSQPSPTQFELQQQQYHSVMGSMQANNGSAASRKRAFDSIEGNDEHPVKTHGTLATSMPANHGGANKRRPSKKAKMENSEDNANFATSPATDPRRKSSTRQRTEAAITSPSSDASPAGANPPTRKRTRKSPKTTLTEDQKRTNHTNSEKARRAKQKASFAQLDHLVPSLDPSRLPANARIPIAQRVQATAERLEHLLACNKGVARRLNIEIPLIDFSQYDEYGNAKQELEDDANGGATPGAQADPVGHA